MNSVKLGFTLMMVLTTAPLIASAQEEEESASPISWELAATSDYVFRGISQSDEKPAYQAGITYTAASGFYAGAWGSRVDFDTTDPKHEVDLFVGYAFDAGDAVNFDVMLNQYRYPSASDLNYLELYTTTTFFDTYKVGINYTNDVWNTGEAGWYYSVGGEWSLPNDFSLGLSVGHSTFSHRIVADDYTDWGVTVGKSWGGLGLSLGYYGTDSHGKVNSGEWADDRLVLTLSYSQ